MKKKILSLALLVLLLVSSVNLVSCISLTAEIESIEWSKMPKTQYMLNEEVAGNKPQFEIIVNYAGEESDTINQDQVKDFEFSTATAGTFTATIDYYGFILSFQYTVSNPTAELEKDKDGNYLINNAYEFTQILLGSHENKLSSSYKLTADIDFEGYDLNDYYDALFATETSIIDGIQVTHFPIFEGVIDGGMYSRDTTYTGENYKIMNYVAPSAADRGYVEQPGLFYVLGNCTFKNIDLVNCVSLNTAAAGAGLFGMGQYDRSKGTPAGIHTENSTTEYTYNFKNINVKACHISGAKNSGFFVGYTARKISINIDNCMIDKFSTAVGQREIGGFIGSTNRNAGDWKISNSSVEATLTAGYVGAIYGNPAGKEHDLEITNCHIGGVFNYTSTAHLDKCITNKHITHTLSTSCDADAIRDQVTCTSVVNTVKTYTGTNNVNKILDSINIGTIVYGSPISFSGVSGADYYIMSIAYTISGSTYFIAETINHANTLSTTSLVPTYFLTYAEGQSVGVNKTDSTVVLKHTGIESLTGSVDFEPLVTITAFNADGDILAVGNVDLVYAGKKEVEGNIVQRFVSKDGTSLAIPAE